MEPRSSNFRRRRHSQLEQLQSSIDQEEAVKAQIAAHILDAFNQGALPAANSQQSLAPFSSTQRVPNRARIRKEESEAYRKCEEKLEELSAACNQLEDDKPLPSDVVFLHPPTSLSPTEPNSDTDYSLDPLAEMNLPYIYQSTLIETYRRRLLEIEDFEFVSLAPGVDLVKRALSKLKKESATHIRDVWLQQRRRLQNLLHHQELGIHTVQDSHFSHGKVYGKPLHIACWFLITALKLIFGVSLREANFVFRALEVIINIALMTGPLGELKEARWSATLHRDSRTALDRFNIDVPTRTYVCCVSCHALYLPNNGEFPRFCSELVENGRVCGEELGRSQTVQGGKSIRIPRKRFEYQSVIDWLGQMLARRSFEKLADTDRWTGSPKKVAQDIWDGEALPNFKWSDGTSFWTGPSRGKNEGRYMFSLSIDWFNAHHSGPSRKVWSVGAIYLVCLNLPPSERFRPENICLVGIIPGPSKPHGDQINHYLKVLVDDLITLWEKGVWYTRTHCFQLGRLVRCALGPVVCDLDAIRAIVGLSSATSKLFCSYCYLTKDDIHNTNISSWSLRTNETHRLLAQQWLSVSLTEKDAIFKSQGTRWSQLVRLPYWDVIRFTALDVMHNMFLGCLARHCRDVWQMNVTVEGGDGSLLTVRKVPSPEEMVAGREVFEKGTIDQLFKLKKHVLESLYVECPVEHKILGADATKAVITTALQKWRRQLGYEKSETPFNASRKPHRSAPTALPATDEEAQKDLALLVKTRPERWHDLKRTTLFRLWQHHKGPEDPDYDPNDSKITRRILADALRVNQGHMHQQDARSSSTVLDCPMMEKPSRSAPLPKSQKSAPSTSARTVIGSQLLEEMRVDMEDTVLPSHIKSAPKRMGHPGHGKLSADEWRSACTINMIFTLGRLWGYKKKETREFQMWENFVHLVLAASLAARRSMTEERREIITSNMRKYLDGVTTLFQQMVLVPNHHLALHLEGFFKDFGPAHSWWAFPFERFNGILQSMKSNFRFNLLEQTLMHSFCEAAQFKSLVLEDSLPPILEELSNIVKPFITSSYRGSLDSDIKAQCGLEWTITLKDSTNATHLDEKAIAAVHQFMPNAFGLIPNSQDCSQIESRGAKYVAIKPGERERWTGGPNSSVIYRASDGVIKHGRIVRITHFPQYSHEDGSLILFIEQYKPLSSVESDTLDVYRHWPDLGCKVVHNTFLPDLEVIMPSQVIAHIARCIYRPDQTLGHLYGSLLVVMSLDRVGIL